MAEVAATLLKHRDRLNEIARVLARHGLAAWAARGSGIADIGPVESLVSRVVSPGEKEASDGERLRGALVELGTTYIKFGQMLSLRPDLVGEDTASELTKLQATVPADPPGVAQRNAEAQLGQPVGELFGSFDAEPFASGSVAQVHRATLVDGTAVAVKVLHDGADVKVGEDLELMQALASYLEEEDPELAQLRPTILVAEFAGMMNAAIDLRQELANLQRFQANFADEPDVVIPTPYADLSRQKVLTMAMISGHPFTDRASVEAAGWDVDHLVHRAADVYLEMIFRDGLYHADPHPGNFLLPDAEHLAILDFGDVGRVTTQRRRQLETMVIAIGTRDVDSLIDVILGADYATARCGPPGAAGRHRDLARPLPPRRCRSARYERHREQRYEALARASARSTSRPGLAVSCPPSPPGPRPRSRDGSTGHRAVGALCQADDGGAVRSETARPAAGPIGAQLGPLRGGPARRASGHPGADQDRRGRHRFSGPRRRSRRRPPRRRPRDRSVGHGRRPAHLEAGQPDARILLSARARGRRCRSS